MLFRRQNGISGSCDYFSFPKMMGSSSYFKVYTVRNVRIWRFSFSLREPSISINSIITTDIIPATSRLLDLMVLLLCDSEAFKTLYRTYMNYPVLAGVYEHSPLCSDRERRKLARLKERRATLILGTKEVKISIL